MVEDNGKVGSKKVAPFYRSLQIDAPWQPYHKRNGPWGYARGRLCEAYPARSRGHSALPRGDPGEFWHQNHSACGVCAIQISWFNTQFSFAGPGPTRNRVTTVTPEYDDRPYCSPVDSKECLRRKRRFPMTHRKRSRKMK